MSINEVQILPFSILNMGQFQENGCLHSWYTEKPCSKPLERTVDYIPVTT